MKDRTDAYDNRAKAMKRNIEEQTKAYNALKAKIRGLEDGASKFEEVENELRTQVRNIKKKAADRKTKLRGILAEIERLERAVGKCQEVVDTVDPEKETALKSQLTEIGREKQALRPKVNNVNFEGRRLADEQGSLQERLEFTEKRYPPAPFILFTLFQRIVC
jgi:chromosome segregation ATPase